MHNCFPKKSGFALLLTLGIVALLLITSVAFLGFSSKSVATANSASEQTLSSEAAAAALQQVVQDLLQEIRAGSIEPTPAASSSIFYPATPLSAVPNRSSVELQNGASPSNLLKQSASGRLSFAQTLKSNNQPVYPQSAKYPAPLRASAISTAPSTQPSNNGISAQRWNRPLLLPRANTASPSDNTPASAGTIRFAGSGTQAWQWRPPDWVYLRADGANPLDFSPDLREGTPNPVVARYAYQMYDIGGLLDANVAGYDPDPLVVGSLVAARRGSLGMADLTQTGLTAKQLKRLLAFRNPATLAASDSGKFGHRYTNFLLNSKSNLGFVRVGVDLGATGLKNQAFTSRSNLISFIKGMAGTDAEKAPLLEALQNLTHFSRSLEQPSFKPGFYDTSLTGSTALNPLFSRPSIVPPAERMDDTLYPITVVPASLPNAVNQLVGANFRRTYNFPFEMALGNNRGGNDVWGTMDERGIKKGDNRSIQDVINPAFLELRVLSAFKRQDGSMAAIGEPLVKKRFPLERLSWVTYRGPSASLDPSNPLYNSEGTPAAILDCMGLVWTRTTDGVCFWGYAHGKMGAIYNLEELLISDKATGRPREPDFFEMLKAGITAGSLGKSSLTTHFAGKSWDPATYIQCRDRVGEFQVLEIGANLIDQYDADSFPTVIGLPNTDPLLNPASATDPVRYSPPLFTAHGVEDLPYFYRFHLRGIEDAHDKPSIPLPAPGGAIEITGNLAAYAGDAFKCGTTVVLGLPELWNPHASDPSLPFDASKLPVSFRMVAASETPKDIIVAAKNANDRGLAANPKTGSLPTLDSTNAPWIGVINNGYFDFLIKPAGFFGYASTNTNTYSFLNTPAVGTNTYNDAYPMNYQTATQVWDWPADNIKTPDISTTPATSLFWSDTPFKVGTLVLGAREPTCHIAVATLSKIPAVDADGNIPMQPKPPNWPANISAFSGKTISKARTDLPKEGDTQSLYVVEGSAYLTWQSGTYATLDYPRTPRISDLTLTHGYTIRPTALTYTNGTPVPNPFPPYLLYRFALTDKAGIQRKLFQSGVAPVPPGATSPSSAGSVYSRTVDLRGTEITFNITNNNLFREPTSLCNVGLPQGSNLKAGPDNFFSGAPYNGSVTDAQGTRWVGISLGEVPTNFILLSKLCKKDRVVQWKNAANPSLGMDWYIETNEIAQDILQNKRGHIEDAAIPLNSFYPLRYFHVPVTTAGVGQTCFTIRLQFKDPNGNWVTYDERFLEISTLGNLRNSTGPVLGRNELLLASASDPQDASGRVAWRDKNRPLGWSMPMVTSYDPRTPRFGNPFRYGYPVNASVYGSNAQIKQALNQSSTNPSALFPNGGTSSDRPGRIYIDLPSSKAAPATLTPRGQAPTAWNAWFFSQANNGPVFDMAYNYAVGTIPKDTVGQTQWWAAGKDTNAEILYKKPSGSALDYGWFPRLHAPTAAPAGASPLTSFKTGITPDTTLPNFSQEATGTEYADTNRPGLLSENIAPSAASATDPNAAYRQAYADPDDIVRRASGGLASVGGYTASLDGLPLAQNTTAANSRPLILNRAFRSVAEMGYAFRAMPWKNVTFFLPETGDAALLDLFCLSEAPPLSQRADATRAAPPLVAGKVNLNTRQEKVLLALLAGALKDELKAAETIAASTDALTAARALIDRTTGNKPWLGPLTNTSELAGKLCGKDLAGVTAADPVYTATLSRTSTEPNRNPDIPAGKNQLTWHYTGYSADLDSAFGAQKDRKNQRLRESAIRALADCGQTRVWNLMLDLVVQTGRIPARASTLGTYQKNSEQRIWVCLAIDRFTGEILEQSNEWVSE